MEQVRDADEAANMTALEKLNSMPPWRPTREKGTGRGGRTYDFNYRVEIYSMLANQVPLSAIGTSIVSIVKRTAPWLEPEAPTRGMLSEARFELRFVEEALAARRVAEIISAPGEKVST